MWKLERKLQIVGSMPLLSLRSWRWQVLDVPVKKCHLLFTASVSHLVVPNCYHRCGIASDLPPGTNHGIMFVCNNCTYRIVDLVKSLLITGELCQHQQSCPRLVKLQPLIAVFSISYVSLTSQSPPPLLVMSQCQCSLQSRQIGPYSIHSHGFCQTWARKPPADHCPSADVSTLHVDSI